MRVANVSGYTYVPACKSAETSFGTRYGKNLNRFIENNRDILSHDNFKNLCEIRNNGLDSVLELESASLKERELYRYKYKLTLRSNDIDKKNKIIHGYDDVNYRFLDYITGRFSEKPIVTESGFPIYIKNMNDDTKYLVARQFDSKNMLSEKIEKEHSQSKIIDREFAKFEQEYSKK